MPGWWATAREHAGTPPAVIWLISPNPQTLDGLEAQESEPMASPRSGFAAALLLIPALSAGGLVHTVDHRAKAATVLEPPIITENFSPVLPCNDNTTLGQEGCAEQKVVALDRQLNADVKVVFGLLADDAARRDFVAAQTAWIKYRSADCNSQSDVYQGGTEQPVVYGLCLASDDASRRLEIKGFFTELTQDRATVPRFP
jgi:uncharacterized protein YecT (DUF1311 family)